VRDFIPRALEAGAEFAARTAAGVGGAATGLLQGAAASLTDPTGRRSNAPAIVRDQMAQFQDLVPSTRGGQMVGEAVGELVEPVVSRIPEPVKELAGQALQSDAAAPILAAGELVGAGPGLRALRGAGQTATKAGFKGQPGATKVEQRVQAEVNRNRYEGGVPPLQRARALNYKVTPSAAVTARRLAGEAQPPAPGGYRAGLAGQENVLANVAIENQTNTNRLLSKSLGLGERRKITEMDLDEAAAPHEAVYDELRRRIPARAPDPELAEDVARLGSEYRDNPLLTSTPEIDQLRARLMAVEGNVSTSDTLAAIRQWRKRARTLFQSSDDPAKLEMAGAYRAAATAFERSLERGAEVIGDQQLVQRFRTARQELAKNHDVRSALVGGDVDAHKIAKIGEKGALTGELEDVAEIARQFGPETQLGSKVRINTPDVGGILGLSSYAVRKMLAPKGIPGLISDEFQTRHFGPVDPSIGRRTPPAGGMARQAPPMQPVQQEMFGSGMDLAPPPGQTPARLPPPPMPTKQLEEFQPFFDLEQPPGQVGRPPNGPSGTAGPDDFPGEPPLPPAPVTPTGPGPAPLPGPSGAAMDPGLRDILTELGLVDDVPPARAPVRDFDLLDLVEDAPTQTFDDLVPQLFEDVQNPYFAQPDRYIFPGSRVRTIGPPEQRAGHIAATPQPDDSWRLTDAYIAPELRGKGLGQQQILAMVEDAEQAGVRNLTSDKSVSGEQLRAYRSAKAKGLIDFDEYDSAAIDEAIASRSRVSFPQPAITNIRRVETADASP
jgi:predicted GNAT family acetyltransferase